MKHSFNNAHTHKLQLRRSSRRSKTNFDMKTRKQKKKKIQNTKIGNNPKKTDALDAERF